MKNHPKQPNKERKKSARLRERVLPNFAPRKASQLEKLVRELPGYTLAKIRSKYKRLMKVKGLLTRALAEWEKETEGKLKREEWPDMPSLQRIEERINAISNEVWRRTQPGAFLGMPHEGHHP